MDTVATFPKEDREYLITQTAKEVGNIHPIIIEKDFWVVWTLKHLYGLDWRQDAVFRGGTNLSKVHKAIARFSEDIDLGLNPSFLGYIDDRDPYLAGTPSGRTALIRKLRRDCRRYVEKQVVPRLRNIFEDILGNDEWKVEPVHRNRLIQVNFHYPRSLSEDYLPVGYISPAVRLEIDPRAENDPIMSAEISSFVADHFPDQFEIPSCSVTALQANRTFWEKVTLVHREFQKTEEEMRTEMFSRHCYDIVMMSRMEEFDHTVDDIELLRRVVRHKKTFYPQRSARYDDAMSGKLKLVPDPWLLKKLKNDYRDMREMIYGEYPEIDQIVDQLEVLEKRINQKFNKR